MTYSNGLNATEQKLAQDLAEAAPETRLQVACNLVRNNHFNWQILHEARVPGLAEAVRRELAGEEAGENLLPQHDLASIPMRTKPEMR